MTGYVILDAAGHRIATRDAAEEATYAGRTTYQDRLGWVVRGDGVVILVHPRVGRRVPSWPQAGDAPANATECPVWAALWRPSTTVEIATETDLPRREVKAALLAYLAAGRVAWTEHVWSRVEAGQAASETPRQVGLGYQPCQRHHPTTTPPASPATPPPCRQRPRRPWSSPAST